MTDRAIDWIRQQKALMPDKPFFTYFAPGATHAPHHVPTEWSDKYKGKFDDGWDALRERTFARQKELGRDPGGRRADRPRPEEIPAWDEMPDDLKPVLARQMEVYAGFLEHTDHHIGRVIDALEELEILDDTLVYYIVGDNGASAEGTPQGCFNELIILNGAGGLETTEFMASRIDKFGTPEAYNHYAVGWAHAMDTPYQWTKQVASHWGGTRNGTIVHWPAGIKAKGEVRTQFSHVIDVAATVLDAAGIPEPTFVHGVQQMPLHGAQHGPQLRRRRRTRAPRDAVLRDVRATAASTTRAGPRSPATASRGRRPRCRPTTTTSGSSTRPTTGPRPTTSPPSSRRGCAELQRLFLIEAARYDVLPLDDRRFERFNADLAGRPQLIHGSSQILFGGMGRLSENSVLVIKNKSHSVTAEIDLPDGDGSGVIVAQGGAFGGWSLYLHEGRPAYCYNTFGVQRFKVYGADPLPAGEHQVRMEFAYDGGGLGKGGDVDAVPGRSRGRLGPGRDDRSDGLLGR